MILLLSVVHVTRGESEESESDLSTSFKTEVDSNGDTLEQSEKTEKKVEQKPEPVVQKVEEKAKEPVKEQEKKDIKSQKRVEPVPEPKKAIDLGIFKKKDIDEDTDKPGERVIH